MCSEIGHCQLFHAQPSSILGSNPNALAPKRRAWFFQKFLFGLAEVSERACASQRHWAGSRLTVGARARPLSAPRLVPMVVVAPGAGPAAPPAGRAGGRPNFPISAGKGPGGLGGTWALLECKGEGSKWRFEK